MDVILRGILISDHPDRLKTTLIEKSILSVAKTSPQFCHGILKLTLEFITTSENSFIYSTCSRVYQEWGAHNQECLYEFLKTERENLCHILTNDTKPLIKYNVLTILAASFNLLSTHPELDELLKVVKCSANRIAPSLRGLPHLQYLCRMMVTWPKCIPDDEFSRSIISMVIVRAVAGVQIPSDPDQRNAVLDDVGAAGILFKRLLGDVSAEYVMRVLKDVYAVISTPKAEPSMALAAVAQSLPLKLSAQIINENCRNAADSLLSDQSLCLALERMIGWLNWPTADVESISNLVLVLLQGLPVRSRYAIVMRLAQLKVNDLVDLLDFSRSRRGAMTILECLLLSYQRSAEVFHMILQKIPLKIQILKTSCQSVEDKEILEEFVELIHTMIHLHTGFPDLYDPVLAALESFRKPSIDKMNMLILKNKCSNGQQMYTTLSDFNYTPRSETGKTGLVNLGNTCYMNSVIQTLYMTDEFRNKILAANPHPKQIILNQLQILFAFLTHTQRFAYSAADFYKVSRPPWFENGVQQDCSEYLRHLLDIMHEQEISILAPVTSSQDNPASALSIDYSPPSPITRNSPPIPRSRATKRKNSGNPSSNPVTPIPLTDEMSMDVSESTPVLQTLIHHTFAGQLVTSYTCFSCQKVSETKEHFIDLHLAFPQSRHQHNGCYNMPQTAYIQQPDYPVVKVENEGLNGSYKESSLCLDDLVKFNLRPEKLEGDNKYFCSNCDKLCDAERSMRIVETPRYLILTLLRFSYEAGVRSKILFDVQYPLLLHLPVSQSPNHSDSAAPPNKLNRSTLSERYDHFVLYAVVVHSGMSSENGHYYTCARHSGNLESNLDSAASGDEQGKVADATQKDWCMFNDSHVSFCNFKFIETLTKRFPKDTAYILMYKKCTWDDAESGKGDIDAKAVPLPHEIRDEIEKDNFLFLNEKEREAKLARCHGPTKPLRYWKDFDDNPPGNCGNGGDGGGFVSVPRFVC